MAAGEIGVDLEEGLADGAGEGEVALEVAGVVVVEEDAADATRLVAVRQEEVAVAPLLEFRIVAGVLSVAGGSECPVEIRGVALLRKHRRQIGAAAEPGLG